MADKHFPAYPHFITYADTDNNITAFSQSLVTPAGSATQAALHSNSKFNFAGCQPTAKLDNSTLTLNYSEIPIPCITSSTLH